MPSLISNATSHTFKIKCAIFLLLTTCLILAMSESVNGFSYHLRLMIKNRAFCRPFTVPDSRPFFEREPPQSNLPRRTSLSSSQLLAQLRRLRLVVLACARNVQTQVDTYRQHIEPILDLFDPSSRLFVFESDSSDGSAQKLREWPRAQLTTHRALSHIYPSRPERIAFCRNTLLSKAHALAPDYILFTDLDLFATTVASFLTNFHYETNDWTAMTASWVREYYDIWALRTLSDSVMNYDVWHRVEDLNRRPERYCGTSVHDEIVRIHQKSIPIEHDLIEVRSAFCGAGLYKANATLGCAYDGRNNTCEHVPFHLCMRDKHQARIFINPAFQIIVSE